jgi:AraC-like DNA-binding protein
VVRTTSILARRQPQATRDCAFIDHAERVFSAAGPTPDVDDDGITSSWKRSAKKHNIDPAASDAPRILTGSELRVLREPLGDLMARAQSELNHVERIVRQARYCVLLCDSGGVAVDHRGDEAESECFRRWGIWLGGVWSEGIEGTNGIGTCIVEQRPINVHRSQHFRSRHIGLSCSGAPIFNPEGELVAVLDVSSFDPRISEQSHALTGALVEAAAQAIAERWFRSRHPREWVVAVAPADAHGATVLFAVDNDQRIVGADRNAQAWLARHHNGPQGGTLWSVFEPNLLLFRRGNREDTVAQLFPIGTSEPLPVVITPPWPASSNWGRSDFADYHARPRLDMARDPRRHPQPVLSRGGLPAGALRRVKDYIEANLDKSIELSNLAGAAGYSKFHFARAFKDSEGITPHGFVTQRRVERARTLVTETDVPISEIARVTGFSDQSHLARHFRQQLGISPSMARRLVREQE